MEIEGSLPYLKDPIIGLSWARWIQFTPHFSFKSYIIIIIRLSMDRCPR